MYKCNICGEYSNIIAPLDDRNKCPYCGEGMIIPTNAAGILRTSIAHLDYMQTQLLREVNPLEQYRSRRINERLNVRLQISQWFEYSSN